MRTNQIILELKTKIVFLDIFFSKKSCMNLTYNKFPDFQGFGDFYIKEKNKKSNLENRVNKELKSNE